MSNTHFDKDTNLLHIKRIGRLVNNTNPWILVAPRCYHNLKQLVESSKDTKALMYYITDYITKLPICTSHKYSLLQITVQSFETNYDTCISKDSIDRSKRLLIGCVNTIGSQQEISVARAISYLMKYLDQLTDNRFSYVLWLSLSM